jgi:hypothetical protein
MRGWLFVLSAATLAFGLEPTLGVATPPHHPGGCGPEWAVVPSPNVSEENNLNGVAVMGENDVWAVGNHLPAGNFRTLTQHWDGSAWEIVASPNDGSKDNSLNGVAAVSADDVWAVGFGHAVGPQMSTLALHWDGDAWTQATTPNLGTDHNLLTAVAAVSARDVWAVGVWFEDGIRRTLIEHFDGSAWTHVPSPSGDTLASVLTDVHAVSSTNVWAVGWTIVGARYGPLALHWDGSTWTEVEVPHRPGEGDILTSLSGASGADLWAVGYAAAPTEHRPLALHWDGATWSFGPVRGPGPDVNLVRGVAAAGPGEVWAVGSHHDPAANLYRSFSLRHDGTRWAAVPTPAMAQGDELKGVAVVEPTGQVWAVGSAGRGTLIETICPRGSDPSDAPPAPAPLSTETTSAPSGASVETVAKSTRRRGGSEATEIFAVDDAVAAGIDQKIHTWSAAVADIDDDGWLDLFIGGHLEPGHLYVNQSGVFVEVAAGTFRGKDRHDCAWADVNLDGLPDLFCSVGARHGLGLKGNDLEVQQPGQEFVEQTAQFALLDPFGRGRHLTFIDVNHDPFPDLFVQNFAVRGDGMPSSNRLYLNQEGAVYRSAPAMGLDVTNGEGCAQNADYDDDGWEDLMFCSGFNQGVKIFRNLAGARFVDVSEEVGLTEGPASGAVLADLNGDGLVDLAQVAMSRLVVMLQEDGVFTLSYTRALTAGKWVAAGDADGDGRPDLYVVQGGDGSNRGDVMLLNDGDGTSFTELDIPQTGRGCGNAASPIDYNRNGLTDFVVLNGCGAGPPGPIQLISFYRA